MLEQIPRILATFRPSNDGDPIDRCINYYSVMMILASIALISAKQYVGSPLQCWLPAHFTHTMEQYTENYCWVESTWNLPLPHAIPWIDELDDRANKVITYYQWTPFILLLQIVLCTFPRYVWRMLASSAGHNPKFLMKYADACTMPGVEDNVRQRQMEAFVSHLCKRRELTSYRRFNLNILYQVQTSKVLIIYLLSKFIYILTLLVQYYVMAKLLGIKSYTFGWDMYLDYLNGIDWSENGLFPRVTLCDFEVRVLGNIHRYTVQCVLMINMFNEKIFMFLWFWFAFCLLLTMLSIIYWTMFFVAAKRYSFVTSTLPNVLSRDVEPIRYFTRDYLRTDVIFQLALLKHHIGLLHMNDLMAALYHKYMTDTNLNQPPKYKQRLSHENGHDEANVKQKKSQTVHLKDKRKDIEVPPGFRESLLPLQTLSDAENDAHLIDEIDEHNLSSSSSATLTGNGTMPALPPSHHRAGPISSNMYPSVYDRRLLKGDGDIESAFDPWTGRRFDERAFDDSLMRRETEAFDPTNRRSSTLKKSIMASAMMGGFRRGNTRQTGRSQSVSNRTSAGVGGRSRLMVGSVKNMKKK